MKIRVFSLALVCASLQSPAVSSSLCAPAETTYFSCDTKSGKTISVCGKMFATDRLGRKTDIDNPWLQYRFGTPSRIELQYPSTKRDPFAAFSTERISAEGGRLHVDALTFESGGVGYSVEFFAPDYGGLYAGVSVGSPEGFGLKSKRKRDNSPKAQILCLKNPSFTTFTSLLDYLDTAH